MGRIGLTYEQVELAAEKLLQQGMSPTIERITGLGSIVVGRPDTMSNAYESAVSAPPIGAHNASNSIAACASYVTIWRTPIRAATTSNNRPTLLVETQ